MRFCKNCQNDVLPNAEARCPECGHDVGGPETVMFIANNGVTNFPRDQLAPSKKIHLLHPDYMRDGTGCGRPLTGRGEIVWTENGVERATCITCIRTYDAYS